MYANSYLLGQIAAEQRKQAERDAAMDALIHEARALQSSDGSSEQESNRLAATVTALMCLVVCRPAQG